MADTLVTWTALPHGEGPDGIRLSVYAALRLGYPNGPDGGTLADYGIMADWPAVIAGLSFRLVTDSGAVLEPDQMRPDPRTPATPDSGSWHALFPANSPVTPFAFTDHSDRALRTSPVRETVAYAQQLYADVLAYSGADLPPLATGPMRTLVTHLGWVRHDVTDHLDADAEQARKKNLAPGQRPPLAAPMSDRATPERSFAQTARFYDRPENRLPDGPYAPPHVDDVTRPKPPDFDVHKALAALADSPTLLRRFGLVLDLLLGEVPPGAVLRLVPVWPQGSPPGGLIETAPWTAFQPRPFLPMPGSDSDLIDGCLQLHGVDDDLLNPDKAARHFDLVQVDPDGTALKLVHTADTGRRILAGTAPSTTGGQLAYDTPTDSKPPGVAVDRAGPCPARPGPGRRPEAARQRRSSGQAGARTRRDGRRAGRG